MKEEENQNLFGTFADSIPNFKCGSVWVTALWNSHGHQYSRDRYTRMSF